jgi:hypothetical protein
VRGHDFAHHPQWHLKVLPDATVEVTKPDGMVLTSRPPARSQAFSSRKRAENRTIPRPEAFGRDVGPDDDRRDAAA